jgi:serine/threonine protein kinase
MNISINNYLSSTINPLIKKKPINSKMQMNSVILIDSNNTNKKSYWIDTSLNIIEIDINYKNIVKKITEKIEKNTTYYREYLKHFYNSDISEMEIERILSNIQKIDREIKLKIKKTTVSDKEKVINIIEANIYFYKKKSKDILVKLYKTTYVGKPAIIKIYNYYPDFIFSKCLIEDRFINEIIFQKYAETLNVECDFISPKIYSFGIISKIPKDDDLPEIYYAFIIMEYIDGISIQNIDFKPDVCKKIYEIDTRLKTKLLTHNDMKYRNIIITKNDDIALLDYGEASYCI